MLPLETREEDGDRVIPVDFSGEGKGREAKYFPEMDPTIKPVVVRRP